jgi:hypothetical protein
MIVVEIQDAYTHKSTMRAEKKARQILAESSIASSV